MWKSAGTHFKNESSTVCTVMGGGYTFSLPELLAADTGLALDNPLLAIWSFAVFDTNLTFICLVITIAFTSLTMIAYLITIITTPRLTTASPLLVPRVGYLSSIVAFHTLIISSAKITATMHKLLKSKPVKEEGIAWSTGGFYVLTWFSTGLICVVFTLSVVLAFKIRPPTSSTQKDVAGTASGYLHVQ
jgi:hypothetical protein